ncbi:MAG TPA: CapA family protein [Pedococcus sp.]|uniref:CapA family protein n=1 Tax=Pedococcus sp. TaxID=2860345 RepID=UPI002F933E96
MRAPPASAVLAAALLATACTPSAGAGAPADQRARTSTPAASSPTRATGTATTTRAASPSVTAATPAADPRTLTLAFGGDVHFEDYLRPVARDPHGLDELRGTLGAADLSMVNLETAITERGAPIGKEFHFRAPASALDTLASAGVDAVSMANNHGADFGAQGLRDTLAARRASPLPVVGIGADEDEAFAPATLEAKGLRVAVLGASQVFEMTLANWSADADSPGIASASPLGRLRTAVQRAASTHDLVVVYLHWGLDYQACPDSLSTQTAQALEAAGADVIVGGHSHRVNAAGWLGRSYVAYGLGNFVWWRSREPDSRTGVLTLEVDVESARGTRRSARSAVTGATWTPMLIGTDGIPRVPSASDGRRLHRLWEQSRSCSGLDARP